MTEHLRDRLDEYIGGLLEPAEQMRFEQHVEACSSCRRLVDDAAEAESLLDLLAPSEPTPVPGPNFYFRVQDNIERNLSQNWFSSLAATLGSRWAYAAVLMVLLAAAFALTTPAPTADGEDGLATMEYPSTVFAQMSFSQADVDSNVGQDLVMNNLVEMADESAEAGR